MLEELNIMKLNFEVKHRFDFSGTLKIITLIHTTYMQVTPQRFLLLTMTGDDNLREFIFNTAYYALINTQSNYTN